MSTKITFNKVDLQYQTESLISTLIVNNGFDRNHRFTIKEGKEVSAKISKALEGNQIIVPEDNLVYQDYYDSFQDIIDMYTLSILSKNFNRFSFNREDVEYEIANSIARAGKIVYRTKEVKVPVQENTKETKSNWTTEVKPNHSEDIKEYLGRRIENILSDIDEKEFEKLPEEQQFEVVSDKIAKEFNIPKVKINNLLKAIDNNTADDKLFNDLFGDIFTNDKSEETSVKTETKEDKKEIIVVTKEMIDKDYDKSKDLFHKKLNDNGIGCGFKVAKLIMKDYKQLLSTFSEEEAFNMILTLINNRGLSYYEEIAKKQQEVKSNKESEESKEKESIKEEQTSEDKIEETIEEVKEESEVPEEAEIVKDIEFPLVEEDMTKDTREEVPVDGKPQLKYEEPKFAFKDGTKEAIKSFLEVSVKTDTKANVRKYISEKINKWEESFNYDNPETIPVYMIKNIKHLKDEFSFIENVDDAGLNNNSITNFIASEFKEALKGMNKATLKELQEFAELCDVVDLMILDEYKAK